MRGIRARIERLEAAHARRHFQAVDCFEFVGVAERIGADGRPQIVDYETDEILHCGEPGETLAELRARVLHDGRYDGEFTIVSDAEINMGAGD